VLPPGQLTRIKLALVRAQKLHILIMKVSESDHLFARLLLDYCIGKQFFLLNFYDIK